MNKTLLIVILLFAFLSNGCGDAEAAKLAPTPPESGREAMMIDGPPRTGKMEKQRDGTYLLRYPDGSQRAVSGNEVVLFPAEGR